MPIPIISIIIPLYNAEKTIDSTLQSVFNQTVADIEIIVVNDGSTDSSLEILRSLNDPRLRVYSFANAGASVSRNRGLELSAGNFIAFLDADDQWTTDTLECQLAAIIANPEAAVAYSWTEHIDEDDHILLQGSRVTVKTQADAYQKLLVSNFLESGSNPLIRREAIDAVGGFDESLQACQDYDFYFRLAKCYAFVTVPKYQVRYRMTSGSISTNTARMEQQGLKFIEKTFATAPKTLQHLRRKRLTSLYRYLMSRSLEGEPDRYRSWLALSYLLKTLRSNPSLLIKQTRFLIVMMVKVLVGLLLPPDMALALLQRFSSRLRS